MKWCQGWCKRKASVPCRQYIEWLICQRLRGGWPRICPHFWLWVCGKAEFDFLPLWFICLPRFTVAFFVTGKSRAPVLWNTKKALRSRDNKLQRDSWGQDNTIKPYSARGWISIRTGPRNYYGKNLTATSLMNYIEELLIFIYTEPINKEFGLEHSLTPTFDGALPEL